MEAFQFLEHPYLVVVSAIISWPVYKLIAQLFFGYKYEKLPETLHYVFQRDWVSLWKGQHWEDFDAEVKFKFFIVVCILWVVAVAELLARLFN